MISTEDLYSIYLSHPTVSTDTRQLPAGCLFFALRGARFDGNQYARAALEAGAAYAVIDDPKALIDERTLLVKDSLKALQQLASHHRQQLGTPVIAITGPTARRPRRSLPLLSSPPRIVFFTPKATSTTISVYRSPCCASPPSTS